MNRIPIDPAAMATYYYGTVPVLAWIINRYFYRDVHYNWLAEEFHPAIINPKSSNPYMIYGDLYWPWLKRDRRDKVVLEVRKGLQTGVDAKEAADVIDNVTAARLRRVCAAVGVDLFYPVVYRVDMERIDPARRVLAGSGLDGSHEVLVPDLVSGEFDLLFADNRSDPDFPRLVTEEIAGISRTSALDVLLFLEGRILP